MNAHHRRWLAAFALVALLTGCGGTISGAGSAAVPVTSLTVAPTTTGTTTTFSSSTTTTTTSTSAAITTTTTALRLDPTVSAAPASGPLRSGRATHYQLKGLGNCMFPGSPSTDGLYVALNASDYGIADLCGAYLAVQGNRGSVTVKVVDQCPECPTGALDLSEEAFARVTGDAGVTNVRWRVVSGPAQPAISYRIKEGSSQWWVGILAVNHRNPVRSLEALVGGRWVALERQEYNYFLASKGLGPGPFNVRLTDSYGERVVSLGLTPDAGRVFTTAQQFAGH